MANRQASKPSIEATRSGVGSFCSVPRLLLLASAFSLTPAFADQDLAARFPNQPHVALADLPPLGSIPTILVSLDPGAMMELLRQDLDEKRRPFDRLKPSRLEPFIKKVLHFPVGSSSRNGFSQGNTYICITTIAAKIPAWNNDTTPPSYYGQPVIAGRVCAEAYGVPVNRATPALQALYTKFKVKIFHDPSGFKIQTLIPATQGPTTPTMPSEPNFSMGTAFFDTLNGRLQEVVWVDATYVMD